MGIFLGDPHSKDDSILGSILGSPYLGKLPIISSFYCLIPFEGPGTSEFRAIVGIRVVIAPDIRESY